MPELFRVFPRLTSAREDQPGGARYVPPQGGGRIDSPGVYSVLYLSDSAAGAIAEAFGRFPEWTDGMLDGGPALAGSRRAIAHYTLQDGVPVCDLDDPQLLVELGLRPSEVVGRNYERTRAWARRIYDQRRWHGIRWWSYYYPAWATYGLWDLARLRLRKVTPLSLDDEVLIEAARTIARRVR